MAKKTEPIEKDVDEVVEKPNADSVKLTRQDLMKSIIDAYSEDGTDVSKKECNKLITRCLKQIICDYDCASSKNIIFLYDDSTLIKSDSDKIYYAITNLPEQKPILMILYSRGGSAASAYLIGKLCREYSKEDNFTIVVPRSAKSAATLICCAANEIHMGSLSELGPIDPQINGLPALGLKNSVEHIAELVKSNPSSAEMFAKYLHLSLDLINLGYYERVAESAMQYAENLLETHKSNLPKPAKAIANDLVYKYKDHGFVIDKAEAKAIFGTEIVKTNTKEYDLGNEIYQTMDLISTVANYLDYNYYFIGSTDSEPTFTKRKK